MPVYGKNRLQGKRHRKILESHIGVVRLRNRREYFKTQKWPKDNTKLADIERALMFDLRGDIAKRIKSGQRPNVLDWGCGNGRAIKRLGRKFNGRINAYGYSDMLYKGWQKEKNVKYIHATKEDMLRYFKNSSLDIIYSHIGLFYLDTDVVKYTGMLLPKLKVGGILLSDIPRLHQLFPKSIELQGMGFKSTFKSGENQVLLIRREK